MDEEKIFRLQTMSDKLSGKQKLFTHHGKGILARFTHDDRWIVSICREDRTLRIWDADTDKHVFLKDLDYEPSLLAVAPHENLIATGGGAVVEVWQLPGDPREQKK